MISINEHRGLSSPLRLALAITLGLLALPYLVDVVYMEDQTPTHSAQETLTDKDNIGEGDVFIAFGADEGHVATAEPTALEPSFGPFPRDNRHDRTVSPVKYLSIASLTSRPPPSV